MDVNHRFWHWSGFVMGAAWAVYFMAVFKGVGAGATVESFFSILHDWQTLAAALVALLGAWMTVRVIREQIDEQRRQEEARRKRRDVAARAALPSALVELVEYSRSAYDYLKAIHLPIGRILHPHGWTPPAPLEMPKDALKVVQDVIETADGIAIPSLKKVHRDFQVLHSRLSGLGEDVSSGSHMIVVQHTFQTHVADSLSFEVLCNSLFDYARDEGGPPIDLRPPVGELASRAFFAGFHESDHPGLKDTLMRRRDADEV